MHESLLDNFYRNALRESDVAFSHRPGLRKKSWTYAELARASFQFAREIETRNIGCGDRVLIWAENSPEWVAAFYGIILRRAIVVPLDPQSQSDFVARVCEQSEPKLLLLNRGIETGDIDLPRLVLEDLPKIFSHHSSAQYDAKDILPSDTVEIVFTSGTTSTPKGVELTHRNLLTNLAPIEHEIDKYIRWEFLVHPLKILSVLPLSHVFGQMIGIFVPQILGATVFFQNRLNPTEIIETIKRERVSVLGAVPRVLETLQHTVQRDYDDGGKLDDLQRSMDKPRPWIARWWIFRRIHRMFGFRFLSFVTGGATLPEATEKFWQELGFAVVQGYGMTETAALISLNNPFSSRRGSLGQVLTGSQNLRIGESGEILVRGENISSGYWGEGKRISDEEWLDTGDIGYLDETGRLYFKGRKKDVIVTAAGLNIFPDDLEAMLNSQPETLASVVVGIDLGSGPEPAAALILRSGNDAETVVARANEALAPFQKIRRWIEWPDTDFPRTATQKVRKNVVADAIVRLLNEGRTDIDLQDSLLSEIISRLSRSGKGVVRPSTRLSGDLDLDSLSRVELLSAIEDRYQIDLDEESLTETTTVGDIERMIRSDTNIRNDPDQPAKPITGSYPRWPLRFPISWMRIVFYRLVIYPITRMVCRVTIEGVENLSGLEGPVIFASNHVTYVDPALIMSALPGRFRRHLALAMDGERLLGYRYSFAAAGLFWRAYWLITYWLIVIFFNAFPLPRLSGFRKSFGFAGEAIDMGYNLMIFPEGELTEDGHLQKFRSGIGLLALQMEATIVPVSLAGLYELKIAGQRGFAPPGSVTVSFGEPVRYGVESLASDVTRDLENRVRKLQTMAES